MDSTMQIDPSRLKQLREQRAWSQEHLAALSGLSVRTIQRLETSGAASHESRLALAAAFGLDPADLAPSASGMPASLAPQPPAQASQVPHAQPSRRRALILLSVAAGLLALDLWHHHAITWSKWPLLAISLLLLIRLLRRPPPSPMDSP